MQAGETSTKQLDVALDTRLLAAVGGVKLVSSKSRHQGRAAYSDRQSGAGGRRHIQ